MNKKGERSNYPLATALDSSNTEMAKRYIGLLDIFFVIDWNILKKYWHIC